MMMRKKIFPRLSRGVFRLARGLAKCYLALSSSFLIKSNPARLSNKKTLLILKPDGIGDLIIFLRFLLGLRKKFPVENWNIVLVANNMAKPLIEDWGKHSEGLKIDQFIGLDRKKMRFSFSYRRQFIKTMKSIFVDVLIMPVFSPDEWTLLIARWIKSPVKFSPQIDNANLFTNKFLLADLQEIGPKLEGNEFSNMMAFLDEFDQSFQSQSQGWDKMAPAFMPFTSSMLNEAAKMLPDWDDYIILFISTSYSEKLWSIDKWKELIKSLLAKGEKIIICGAPGDEEKGARIAEGAGQNLLNLVGKTSLLALTGMLSRAKLVISVDTFFVHLAAMYNIQVIGVMGGMHPYRFWPYEHASKQQIINYPMPCFGCRGYCIYVHQHQTYPCIEKISSQDILGCLSV
ncbi:MAG: glycosyl transferase family 9 [Gammaproteobacteria bacterium]|jgi:ADP-heptose:LPS heptosyltransferase|nr:glycosyl transferase family 9 [Gammaproteobacteria bacterium]